MKLSGRNECPSCGREYTWEYIVPDESAEKVYDVSEYVEGRTYAKRLNLTDKVAIYSCYCPYCEQKHRFETRNKS